MWEAYENIMRLDKKKPTGFRDVKFSLSPFVN